MYVELQREVFSPRPSTKRQDGRTEQMANLVVGPELLDSFRCRKSVESLQDIEKGNSIGAVQGADLPPHVLSTAAAVVARTGCDKMGSKLNANNLYMGSKGLDIHIQLAPAFKKHKF